MKQEDSRDRLVLSVALGGCATLIWYFHDRFWWPVDEGIYAYVAQRLNAGDVLHRDLIDLHAGYVNWLHAVAFRIFGEDLLSLRYPLAGLTLIQAGLAASLLRPIGPWQAALAALAATCFSFIQFINPSANWYALFLVFATAWVLTRIDASRARDAILVGFLIGLCFLLRQLSGVLLAIGVMTWLLTRHLPAGEGRAVLARTLVIIMALGLSVYLWSKGSAVGILMIGVWPLAVLLLSIRSLRVADVVVARLILNLAAGAALAAMPLILYHLMEHSLGAWLNDILFTALLIHEQDFIARSSFLTLIIGGLLGLTAWRDPVAFLNGLFWLTLCLMPAMLGVAMLRDAIGRFALRQSHPLPIMALFFAVVALHFQIPVYLFFAMAPVLVALILIVAPDWRGKAGGVALAALCAVAILYQAGQPLSRGLAGIIRGDRVALDGREGLPRADLRIERSDQEVFGQVLARIESEPDDFLFTLPMDPEFNFITGRPAPVAYFGTPLGLRRDDDVGVTMARLMAAAPLFIVHRRDDKYMTPLSQDLLARIRTLVPLRESYGPFDLYRLPVQNAPPSSLTVRE